MTRSADRRILGKCSLPTRCVQKMHLLKDYGINWKRMRGVKKST